MKLLLLAAFLTFTQADRSPLGVPRKLVLPDLGSILSPALSNSNNIHAKVKDGNRRQFVHTVPPSLNLSTSIVNTTHDFTFLPTAGGEIDLDAVQFFDQNLNEPGVHVPNFPPGNANIHAQTNAQGFSRGNGRPNGPFSLPIPQPFNIQGEVGSDTGVSTLEPFEETIGYSNSPENRVVTNQAIFQPFRGSIGFNQGGNNRPNHQPTVPVNTFRPEVTRPIGPPQFVQENDIGVNRGNFPHTGNGFQLPFDPHAPTEAKNKLEEVLTQEWNEFRTRFNKAYATVEEELYRREVFIENRAKIERFNSDYAEGRRSFVQRLNPYADLLSHEFTNQLCGFNRSRSVPRNVIKPPTAFIPSANVVFPESVDWREVGAVGPVKTQGKCAACWAFAAAGALEGHHFRKTGNLVDVSAQNLIDCTEPYGNNGCSGGLMDPAFEYVRDNNGVDSEQSYPFEERTAECRFRRENVVATCTGFVDIGENDEKGLEIALATLGPVTAAIDAGRETFQFYSDGIYDDPECGNKPEQMNHAVLIVGYGTDPDGRKYWLVKNSYGPQWGIGGYIKLAKDNGNQCGIAIQASYPLV